MPSTINADNGVSSGSAGLKSTADSSGVLALQTNGTTAISIDASQAVSFTNQPTYSGGTANGVAYLNGSKVLTTGSALTFDGTNVDLGTVGAKLNFATTGSSTRNYIGGSADGYSLEMVMQRGASQPLSYKQNFSVGHEWGIAGSGAMTLTSTGLGLGVTPSAWNNIFKAVQINAQGALMATSASMQMGNNVYYDGAYKFIGTGYANRYYQATGQHVWTVSTASGSAGGAITETQAMTLSASGQLGLVGATSPTNSIDIQGTAGTPNVGITINNNSGGSYGGLTLTRGGSAQTYLSCGGIDGYINAYGGVLGIGTSSPDSGAKVTVQGSSGANGMAVKAGTNGNYGIYFNNTSNSTVGGIIINSGSVAYNTTSDYRLKENIAPMTGALSKVAQLKPCTYTWKADGSSTEGFIAHELAEVCPQAVSGEKDAVDADGKPVYQGIDTSYLVATLTAAIQEQQAIITQLQADVASLKGA